MALIDPNNCFFRSADHAHVQVARQIVLLVTMLGFFCIQSFLAPFVDPISNASEWTSRLNYVLTSAIALAVALNVSYKDTLKGPFLYTYVYPTASIIILVLCAKYTAHRVYIVTYALGACKPSALSIILSRVLIFARFYRHRMEHHTATSQT